MAKHQLPIIILITIQDIRCIARVAQRSRPCQLPRTPARTIPYAHPDGLPDASRSSQVTGSSTRAERDRELLKRAVDLDEDETGLTMQPAASSSASGSSHKQRRLRLKSE